LVVFFSQYFKKAINKLINYYKIPAIYFWDLGKREGEKRKIKSKGKGTRK